MSEAPREKEWLRDEDDFDHYFNATVRANQRIAELERELAEANERFEKQRAVANDAVRALNKESRELADAQRREAEALEALADMDAALGVPDMLMTGPHYKVRDQKRFVRAWDGLNAALSAPQSGAAQGSVIDALGGMVEPDAATKRALADVFEARVQSVAPPLAGPDDGALHAGPG